MVVDKRKADGGEVIRTRKEEKDMMVQTLRVGMVMMDTEGGSRHRRGRSGVGGRAESQRGRGNSMSACCTPSSTQPDEGLLARQGDRREGGGQLCASTPKEARADRRQKRLSAKCGNASNAGTSAVNASLSPYAEAEDPGKRRQIARGLAQSVIQSHPVIHPKRRSRSEIWGAKNRKKK